MCKPIISFRVKLLPANEYRFFSVLAINPEADLILYDCQFSDGSWSRCCVSAIVAFCDRTQMELTYA